MPIVTDEEGLNAGPVQIDARDRAIPGYRARPAGGGPFPVALVVQEIFGVNPHIQDICRRLAKEGYYAVAPEMFVRQGDVSSLRDHTEIIRKIVSQVPDSQVMSDLDDTVAWAAKDEAADVSRLVATGFCWGGRVIWLYAAHSTKLKAAAAWYGQIIGTVDEKRPRSALQVAPQLKAPVIGLYGEKDQSIPVADVERMRDVLRTSGKTAEIEIYPEAGHAFHADYRPQYHEASAKDAWGKMLAWFRKY